MSQDNVIVGAVLQKNREVIVEKKFLRVEELSTYMGTPVATLYTWTHQKKIPHLKVGRSVRFDRDEINLWLKGRRVAVSAFADSGAVKR